MSWNEPGGGNKNPRDPWGGGNQGPPDLDEAFKKLQKQLGGMFGGGGGGSGRGAASSTLFGIIFSISRLSHYKVSYIHTSQDFTKNSILII